jgi:serine phosphatase RsbU (regulator of sigma subunit)
VVSGDFYWIEQKGDQLWFAVSDCTGHGVPGAFMSIVGYTGLEKALEVNKLEKPSDILDDLNKNVLNTIHQDDRQMAVHDGMDIALCRIDLKTLKLDFSGANNAMYMVRKGVLSQVNADRQPIGYYVEERRQPFNNQEFQLEKGDIIYLFSDGFPDQFGGSHGKKFKYRPFKKLLESMYELPMPQQKEKLKKTIQEWMGNEEQIDDICIIGVRI